MIYNTIEQDSAEPITEYKQKPTFGETFEAATTNFTSVSLSNSKENYYTDEVKQAQKGWIEKDPKNEATYKDIGYISEKDMDLLQGMYDEGGADAIRGFNVGHRAEWNLPSGDVFLKYKELQTQFGHSDLSELSANANNKAITDYQETDTLLKDSDHWFAELAGTMYGALHDPITLMTLPMGEWKVGESIAKTAFSAAFQEARIEAAAQAVIAPKVYAYKNELGMKTTIKDVAYNAAISIASAGMVRGVGSAAFDLTAKGIKALKVKDPELGAEYENLVKSQATDNLDEHIQAMHKAEFNEEAEIKIANPNEKGIELEQSKPIPVESEDLIKAAQEAKDFRTPKKQPVETLDTERVQKYVGDRKGADYAELDLQLQKIEGDYEGPAIRGMLDTEGTLAKLEVGNVYETRGVTSIAKDKDTADLFAKEEFQGKTGEKVYVNFESFTNKPVNIGEGNKIGFDSMLEEPKPKAKGTYIEDEVLIPSGRSFEVVKKEKIGDETHITVKETVMPEQAKPDPREMKLYSGEDEAGNPIYKSHNELKEEADMDALWIQKAKDCII